MTDTQPSAPRPKITPEEMERRRRAVEHAAHDSAMEGVRRDPRTDHVFDAFVRGDIEISDMIPMIKKALGDE
ncbi:hypothetical protein IC232_04515 [Microvirga sp. BT688]|uniref:antitoxin VbhA family protein n=1 Tax=Microvirga sp. TaxID=1873136 RepID=UPI0016875AA3|nr:hypothetical protein [Microvirga sp.]